MVREIAHGQRKNEGEIMGLQLTGRATQATIVTILVALSAIIPVYLNFAVPLLIAPFTQDAYDVIDALPEGAWIWTPGASYSNLYVARGPFEAFIKFLLEKDANIVMYSAGQGHGAEMGQIYTLQFFREIKGWGGVDLKDLPFYGENIVYLGYVPIPREVWVSAVATDITAYKDTDYAGTPLSSFPMLQEPDAPSGVEDFDFMITWGGGLEFSLFPAIPKVTIGDQPTIPVADWTAGLIQGVVAGPHSFAEFEFLTGYPGSGTSALLTNAIYAIIAQVGIIGGIIINLSRRFLFSPTE